MHTPTVDTLIKANEHFYRTFEALHYPALAELWEHSERAFCVHPGWPALRGSKAVLDSWRRIIGNTAEIHFTLTGVDAFVAGDVGVVTLYEHIYNQVGDERQASTAVASNLFAYDAQAGLWKLFHHHASHSEAPPEEPGGTLLV